MAGFRPFRKPEGWISKTQANDIKRQDDADIQALYSSAAGPDSKILFVDESIIEPRTWVRPDGSQVQNPGVYIISGVLVEKKDLDELRQEMEDNASRVFPVRGDSPPYWHTTKALQSAREDYGIPAFEDMLETLNYYRDTVQLFIGVERWTPNGSNDPSQTGKTSPRMRALAKLVFTTAQEEGLHAIVFERSADKTIKSDDEKTVESYWAAGKCLSISPASETLLWLPDIVSASYRHSLLKSVYKKQGLPRLFQEYLNHAQIIKMPPPAAATAEDTSAAGERNPDLKDRDLASSKNPSTGTIDESTNNVKPDDEPDEDNGLTGGVSPKPKDPTPPKPQTDGAKIDSTAEEIAEQRLARQYAEYLAAGYGTDANLPDAGEMDREIFSNSAGGTRRTQSAEDDGNTWQQNHRAEKQAKDRNNNHGNSR